MDFGFHQHGGSRLYTLQGETGAAVLFMTMVEPLEFRHVVEAGVHLPAHGSSLEPGECPYVEHRRCRYIHVSHREKQEFVAGYNNSRTDDRVERHLTAWYDHYVRG